MQDYLIIVVVYGDKCAQPGHTAKARLTDSAKHCKGCPRAPPAWLGQNSKFWRLTGASDCVILSGMRKSASHVQKNYVGIHQDDVGLSPTANIIRDAWVFGILPETETCEGWNVGKIQGIYDKVAVAWGPYGSLVGNLPPELRERHARIYAAAIQRARELGWNPELGEDD